MKKLFLFIASIVFFSACENPTDCLMKTGAMTSKIVEVAAFSKIEVHTGIALVVTQGDIPFINVVSGENLINDIEVSVQNGKLILRDKTTCNWVRDYGQTTVYVTAPNITELISKTEQTISSGNTLTYPELKLAANDLSNGAGTGDFNLVIDNDVLEIDTNNIAGFYLSGETVNLIVGFFEGNGILQAQNLISYSVFLFHRGSNDLYVHPTNDISGNIYSTGNVYCSPQPPIVNVERHYKGKLIFN